MTMHHPINDNHAENTNISNREVMGKTPTVCRAQSRAQLALSLAHKVHLCHHLFMGRHNQSHVIRKSAFKPIDSCNVIIRRYTSTCNVTVAGPTVTAYGLLTGFGAPATDNTASDATQGSTVSG